MTDPDKPDWSALFDVSGLLNTGARSAPSSGAMPFMITMAQKAKLLDLGYNNEAISQMTPEQAHRFLNAEEL